MTNDKMEQRLAAALEKTAPRDYSQFNAHQKDQLGALINHINALSKLINKKIQ